MLNIKIDSKKLKLAQIKYFDVEHNGLEVTGQDVYAFLYDVNGTYVNPFNVFEEMPVYKRVPYSNTTLDGEDYGSKIVLAQGESVDGLSYVICNTGMEELFGNKELDTELLKKYMISSSRFFIDRLPMMAAMLPSLRGKEKRKMEEKMADDSIKLGDFVEYVASHNKDAYETKVAK